MAKKALAKDQIVKLIVGSFLLPKSGRETKFTTKLGNKKKKRMTAITKQVVQKAIDEYIAGLQPSLRELNLKVIFSVT